MPRKKTCRPSRPVHIGRTIAVTWSQVSLRANLERTPRGRSLEGVETKEYLWIGGTLDEPLGTQTLAQVSFSVRGHADTPITGVGHLFPQGGQSVHISLDVTERQYERLMLLAACKSILQVGVGMDEPKRGHARVESWSVITASEEDIWV